MDKPTHVLIVVAMTVVILGGVIFITKNQPRIDCWNFFGLTKGCTASVNP